MKKKEFTQAELEILSFGAADVITASIESGGNAETNGVYTDWGSLLDDLYS